MRLLVSRRDSLAPFLRSSIDGCSGKKVRQFLGANLCRVNGKIERFGSRVLEKGDVVELAPAWKTYAAPSSKPPFKTLYEDERFLFVDKPAGWVSSPENCERTFGPSRHLVHRLDKDTTGVLAIAKTKAAKKDLEALFKKRSVEKEYLAIVDGAMRAPSGRKKSLLMKKRVFHGQTIWGSGNAGAEAVTEWERLAVGKDSSLVLCRPVTGKTHQIRVHLAEAGHPLLVDRQYAAYFRSTLFAERPLLHARRLRFFGYDVVSPLPLDMRGHLHTLRMQVGHLGELFRGEPEKDSGNQGHEDENREEVEEGPHFLHDTCQHPAVKKRKADAGIPDPDR